MLTLPAPRGDASAALLDALHAPPGVLTAVPVAADDPLSGDDLHLALYLLYELHYRGLPGIDDGWEWDPALLTLRAALEARFRDGLFGQIGEPSDGGRMRTALGCVVLPPGPICGSVFEVGCDGGVSCLPSSSTDGVVVGETIVLMLMTPPASARASCSRSCSRMAASSRRFHLRIISSRPASSLSHCGGGS